MESHLGERAHYVVQDGAVGDRPRGDAGCTHLQGKADAVLVFYADMPMLSANDATPAGSDPLRRGYVG